MSDEPHDFADDRDWVVCPICHGLGPKEGMPEKCPHCLDQGGFWVPKEGDDV